VRNALAVVAAPAIEDPPITYDPSTRISVWLACPADLGGLQGELGSADFFTDRLQRQRDDKGELLVAKLDGDVAGTVYLWLEKAEEKRIRTRLGGVPLLTHLEVKERYRDKGIGTALIKAVELRVAGLNRQRIALAVRTDNSNARRLYQRLNYRDWGFGIVRCRKYNCPRGELEKCNVLIKSVTTARHSQRHQLIS
jgi:GNAT superfamily N-acetyltransferase